MPKYIFLYRGEPTDMSAMSEDDVNAEMAKWGVWAEKCGPALLDMGAPFGNRTSVVDDGSEAAPANQQGYGIVEAADLEAAKGYTDGHPFLADGNGEFAIDIYELIPM